MLSPSGHPILPLRRAGEITWYGRYLAQVARRSSWVSSDVHGVQEGNWAWRCDVLRSIKFDPLFDRDDGLHYGLDLCLQAKQLGYRVIYEPRAETIHHAAPRPGGTPRSDKQQRALIHGRNMTWIGLKHYRGPRRILFLLWWSLIGERQSYGLLTGFYDLCLRGKQTGPLLKSSLLGRLNAVRAWRS